MGDFSFDYEEQIMEKGWVHKFVFEVKTPYARDRLIEGWDIRYLKEDDAYVEIDNVLHLGGTEAVRYFVYVRTKEDELYFRLKHAC